MILDDTEVFDQVFGQVFGQNERRVCFEELLTWMVALSDNTSTNVLIDKFGMGLVNEYCEKIGMRDTILSRKMLDFEAAKNGNENYTTLCDQFLLFEKLVNCKILLPAFCDVALNILKKQRSSDMLLRYIWEDANLAHKTGGLDYLCHDAGVFFRPGEAYFLGVFLQGSDKKEGDKRLAGNISRAVFDYYKTKGGVN
jgi:beta-lactamase class A